MASVRLHSALWLGLALLASLVSIRVGISVALVEIVVGAVAGNLVAHPVVSTMPRSRPQVRDTAVAAPAAISTPPPARFIHTAADGFLSSREAPDAASA
jgi:hypothetical protein